MRFFVWTVFILMALYVCSIFYIAKVEFNACNRRCFVDVYGIGNTQTGMSVIPLWTPEIGEDEIGSEDEED